MPFLVLNLLFIEFDVYFIFVLFILVLFHMCVCILLQFYWFYCVVKSIIERSSEHKIEAVLLIMQLL